MDTIPLILYAFLLLLICLAITHLLVGVIWFVYPLFRFNNRVLWWLYDPLRRIYRNPKNKFTRTAYFLLFPIYLTWWIILYIYSTPLRYINSFYFNMLLFLSVSTRDALSDLFSPQFTNRAYQTGFKYYAKWLLGFPYRLLIILLREGKIFLQALTMFLFDLVWPTLTLYHGTHFGKSGHKIVKDSKWLVGDGDFAGSGIYFAISQEVAVHYSKAGDPAILLCRVNLTIPRPIATLKQGVRQHAGTGGRGELISKSVSILTGALEHWRDDRGGWYEYCLVQPDKKNEYISTWRIRPICVLKKENNQWFPRRLEGGSSFWPWNIKSIIAFLITMFILFIEYGLCLDLIK